MDGHKKCNIRLSPFESMKINGMCPRCGKPLTLGVLNRVEELSDKPKGKKLKRHHPFNSMIPLEEILSEILKVGPKSKKVQNSYFSAINTFGPELEILNTLPEDVLKKSEIPLLGEAIKRMRNRKIKISPGYDGEFGKIRLFNKGEID